MRELYTEENSERTSGPVQLSKFLGRDKDEGVQRSAISGKKIMMKLEKSKEDKQAESKRNELLKFLNASYDWQFVGSAVICCLLDLSWYYRLVHQCCWLYLQVFCSLLF